MINDHIFLTKKEEEEVNDHIFFQYAHTDSALQFSGRKPLFTPAIV